MHSRIYDNLPEVKKKQEEKQKRIIIQSNRLRVEIFKKVRTCCQCQANPSFCNQPWPTDRARKAAPSWRACANLCKPYSKPWGLNLVLGVRHFFRLELTTEPSVGISIQDTLGFFWRWVMLIESCTSAVNPGADMRRSQVILLHVAHKYQVFPCFSAFFLHVIPPFLSKMEKLSMPFLFFGFGVFLAM